jgi:hypothetical protein
LSKTEWRFSKGWSEISEKEIFPIFFIDVVTVLSENLSTVTLFNSIITDGFSHWMFTIGFLFLEFDRERGFEDIFVSSNNGITTIFSLTLSHNSWGVFEGIDKEFFSPSFVHIRDSSDDHLGTTFHLIVTGFGDYEMKGFSGVPFIEVFPFF